MHTRRSSVCAPSFLSGTASVTPAPTHRVDEFTAADGHKLGPNEVYEYLSQVMYARRSKFNPLWNSLLVGGYKDGTRYATLANYLGVLAHILSRSFLSYVDLLGTTYSASTLATGYGAYIALPLLRKAVEGRENSLTEDEARKIMEESLKVLFYRDARSLNKASSPTHHSPPWSHSLHILT